MFSTWKFALFVLLGLVLSNNPMFAADKTNGDSIPTIPFATDSNYLTIWNGTAYIPFFMKGVNLGISVPGTFPGELAATKEEYLEWFEQIQEIGFNCIRLYTLHYPRFYEALYEYNSARRNSPLMLIQGVWLEEEIIDYDEDLHSLTPFFMREIEENIDVIHGNRVIAPRLGKAFGTFTHDVSEWCMAIIIGREVYPLEVLNTDSIHEGESVFEGKHLTIDNATPSEVWFTRMLDHTIAYQYENYQTMRPVSNSSWPTLDPIKHPEEPNRDEDTAQIDLSKIKLKNAPAGLFVSYHAYPYYPDFIGTKPSYMRYRDEFGSNSYVGYLTELKSHYLDKPLIIAEYGVPSSWGIAHYASSNMNHGGFDEYDQGFTDVRMLQNIRDTKCGGGIQFAWMDEWFKRTWVTDPMDYIADSRILWHNIASAEQNYGLIKFGDEGLFDTLQKFSPNQNIQYIAAKANKTFLEIEIGLKDYFNIPDELWVGLDTYSDALGELIMPNGVISPSRNEFALKITNYKGELMVTQAYDLYGIWHGWSEPEQLYRSIPTNGAPWEIVRLRNNYTHMDVQFIGDLRMNYGFQYPTSMDGVRLYNDKIHIRLPWSYINVLSPDQMKVIHDDRSTPEREDTISDGVKVNVYYQGEWFTHQNRYTWDVWTRIADKHRKSVKKTSYFVMKDQLPRFNTPAIAMRDSFYFEKPPYPIVLSADSGVLSNDYDIDGNLLEAVLIEQPKNGFVNLSKDGAFNYFPAPHFNGLDTFKYAVFDGVTLSTSNFAIIKIDNNENALQQVPDFIFGLFPNPSSDFINVNSNLRINELNVFDISGQLIETFNLNGLTKIIDISSYSRGVYFVTATFNKQIVGKQFVKF